MNRRRSAEPKQLIDAEKFLGSICLFTSGALFVLVIDLLVRV